MFTMGIILEIQTNNYIYNIRFQYPVILVLWFVFTFGDLNGKKAKWAEHPLHVYREN